MMYRSKLYRNVYGAYSIIKKRALDTCGGAFFEKIKQK